LKHDDDNSLRVRERERERVREREREKEQSKHNSTVILNKLKGSIKSSKHNKHKFTVSIRLFYGIKLEFSNFVIRTSRSSFYVVIYECEIQF
jgi:hypothetical protein